MGEVRTDCDRGLFPPRWLTLLRECFAMIVLNDSGRAMLAMFGLFVVCAGVAVAETAPHGDWHPHSVYSGDFDWIQMSSGEWVKGSIIAMYDGDLEFDSDEFGKLTLGWHKIEQIRTSQVVNVRLLRNRSAVGKLVLVGDEVTVYGQQVEQFDKRDVLTITAGVPKEINFWDMDVFVGMSILSGNSDVREATVLADFKRRTILNRILLDFAGSWNVTDDVDVADSQRVGLKWDKFINDRFFVTPIFGEYYRDPFQNIRERYTVGFGLGYQLIDSSKVDWSLSGGPGYQETHFESVPTDEDANESTPALAVGTRAEWEIFNWLDLDGNYRLQFVNEASGSYNHHMVVSLEFSVTRILDFEVAWIWDRIENPRADAAGITPKSDDFRTAVGLSFEF